MDIPLHQYVIHVKTKGYICEHNLNIYYVEHWYGEKLKHLE